MGQIAFAQVHAAALKTVKALWATLQAAPTKQIKR